MEKLFSQFGAARRTLRNMSEECRHDDVEIGAGKTTRIAAALSRLRPWLRPARRSASETLLPSSSWLPDPMCELSARLTEATKVKLLLDSIDHIERFCEAQARLRKVFVAARDRLREAIDRNAAEEFRLSESEQLKVRFDWELRALNLMAYMSLSDIKQFASHDVVDALPELVYSGAVLYTVHTVAKRSEYASSPGGD